MTAHTAIRLIATAFCAIVWSQRASSQIQITRGDVEGLVGTFQVSYPALNSGGFDLSVSGPNRHWDLSAFTFSAAPGMTVTHLSFPPAGAPDVGNPAFAQANYAIKNEDASAVTWQYAKVSSSGVEVIGNVDTATSVLTPGLKIVGTFPLAYGSSWSSTSSVASPILPSGFTATIAGSGSIDSWGTMVIPTASGGTISKSVLRLRLQQTTTIKMSFIILYQFSSVNYQWLGSPSEGQFYVAAVSTDSVGAVRTLSFYTPFNVGPVSLAEERDAHARLFALLPNYPNPFNPETVIPFDIPREGHVELTLYNLLGQAVATVFSGRLEAGAHEVRFNAQGSPSGLYIVRLEADGAVLTRTMTLLK